MSLRLFLCIASDLATPFITLQHDAREKVGSSTLQKYIAALRQLTFDTSADSLDEYLRMTDQTVREFLYNYCKWVIRLYNKEYLYRPTQKDVQALYSVYQVRHGFLDMLGRVDCMRGEYMHSYHGHPTVMLEAVASHVLWIWHAFFGVAGLNNDVNVLRQSDIFNKIAQGTTPDTSFIVSGVEFMHGYYLANGIYPDYAAIVKIIPFCEDPKRKKFAKYQESARKDVKRLFGVLKQKWHIVQNPA